MNLVNIYSGSGWPLPKPLLIFFLMQLKINGLVQEDVTPVR